MFDEFEDIFSLTAYPNPFSENTTIQFRLSSEERVRLVVYNTAGQLVASLYEAAAEAGELYSIEFKAHDNPHGMYFYRLITESGDMHTKKFVLTK